MSNPFRTSGDLASWVVEIIKAAGVDELAQWRMLEYWMQVELYRAFQAGQADAWSHLGEYEQPYFTRFPKPGSKTNWKWIDLVVAEPELDSPKRVTWLELKDLGRSTKWLIGPKSNAWKLGFDLAALAGLDPQKTADGWEKPPKDVIDEGRLQEWQTYAGGIRRANHLTGQIVLVSKRLLVDSAAASVIDSWLRGFDQRARDSLVRTKVEIESAETDKMVVLATVLDLGHESNNERLP